jgi:hypothetical protein
MLVFDISDFAQNATKVFDAALTDEVIINNKNGKSYKILPIRKSHSDNSLEFINNATEIWCKDNSLSFIRSHDHKKNDNCLVEQKNGAVVRGYVGYDRLEGLLGTSSNNRGLYTY